MKLATFAKSESNFDEAPFEKHGQRNHGLPVVIGRFDKLRDFTALQKQFAFSLTRVIEDAGLSVFGDIAINKPDFAIIDSSISFFDGDLVVANAFDFAAGKDDAAVRDGVQRF